MQLTHLKNIDIKKEASLEIENKDNLKKNLIDKNIKEENIEANLSNQIKNQLKNTDQIKKNPVKNLSSEINKNKIEITSFQDLIDQANKDKELLSGLYIFILLLK